MNDKLHQRDKRIEVAEEEKEAALKQVTATYQEKLDKTKVELEQEDKNIEKDKNIMKDKSENINKISSELEEAEKLYEQLAKQ